MSYVLAACLLFYRSYEYLIYILDVPSLPQCMYKYSLRNGIFTRRTLLLSLPRIRSVPRIPSIDRSIEIDK